MGEDVVWDVGVGVRCVCEHRCVSISVFFLMIRRPPRSTLDRSSAASDVYKRQVQELAFRGMLRSGWEGSENVYSAALLSSVDNFKGCLLYTSPSPRDRTRSRMPSSA